MNEKSNKNLFLNELISLQQDGKYAISAPANWITQKPLLEVPTRTDSLVNDLTTSILRGDTGNTVARWHFFIGSPGNGKSAVMGKICRNLFNIHSCRIEDENRVSIEDLDINDVPYALRVFEPGNNFASVMIVQDASVVRNPFSADVDPAAEIISTLEDAWEKGISLVVCTNRGVIEKAFRERYLEQNYNTKSWFRILRQLMGGGDETAMGDLGDGWNFESSGKVFNKAHVTYYYLDNESLLIGSETFNELISKATAEEHWSDCRDCSSASLCSFKLNRDWLKDDMAKENFIKTLRRAEAISGQVVVFREGLAFLSFILAGCPRDYQGHHPCDWIHKQIAENNIFALAMRRIYMSVFNSFTQFGLENNATLRKQQHEAIGLLRDRIEDEDPEINAILNHVLQGQPPSTDVGVERLTEAHGVLAEIDPYLEHLPTNFRDAWDSELSVIASREHDLLTEIELRCIEVWIKLEELVEGTSSHESNRCHWALKRWSSNYLLHLGGLLEGRTAWAVELDDFIAIVQTLLKDPSTRSTEEKRRIRELDAHLEKLLVAGMIEYENCNRVPLSEMVTLSGRWVADKLRPRIDASKKTGGLYIPITFHDEEITSLNARAFLWLNRHLNQSLDTRCFPLELLAGIIDARIRAAALGDVSYAFDDNDVELNITTDGEESFTILRFDGDVDIERRN